MYFNQFFQAVLISGLNLFRLGVSDICESKRQSLLSPFAVTEECLVSQNEAKHPFIMSLTDV